MPANMILSAIGKRQGGNRLKKVVRRHIFIPGLSCVCRYRSNSTIVIVQASFPEPVLAASPMAAQQVHLETIDREDLHAQ